MRISLCHALSRADRLASALEAVPNGALPAEIKGLATHSDEVRKGDVFVALQGQQRHGADYIRQALEHGASAVLASAELPLPQGCPCLLCDDPIAALQRAAATQRAACRHLIAISGSAGKTTVKEAIVAVLSQEHTVAYSRENFNSTIGLPLSMLSFEKADYFVVEIGISHPGEMEPLARLCTPDVALLTNVGSAHIGHFQGAAHLRAEKARIASFLSQNGRFLIPFGLQFEKEPCPKECVLRFGRGGDCRLEVVSNDENGVSGDLIVGDRVITNLSWPISGEIGIAVLEAVGLLSVTVGAGEDALRRGIAQAALRAPRMQVLSVGAGEWIDDAYNASPEAMRRSLDVLKARGRGKMTVAVLGDMLELGEAAAQYHLELGAYVKEVGIDLLLTYGSLALYIAKGAVAAGMSTAQIRSFEQGEEEALKQALSALPQGATVIFKASGRMQLSRPAREVASKL